MIKIDKLAFSYGAKTVLENITMSLEPGKVYGLLGENGVGKTTLLTLLCGLKKPQRGTVSVDGMAPFRRLPSTLADQYFLPDDVAPVNDKAASWAQSSGRFWSGFDYSKFLEIMKLFENDPSRKMNQMSAGQLKKTYISFALACNTRYLYMDEPTNGLDIPGKAQFRSAITRFTDEDATVIISTHQVRDLENIIDPIIILDRDGVLLNADTVEISRKLTFDYGTTLNPASLYTEQLPGGFIQVYPNTDGNESNVNIEALFNTAHKHKDLIKTMFSHE